MVDLCYTLLAEVATLVLFNADINLQDVYKDSPLHAAALGGLEDIVLCLVSEFGCDPNKRGHSGRSVLFLACENCTVSLVQTLIQDHKAGTNV